MCMTSPAGGIANRPAGTSVRWVAAGHSGRRSEPAGPLPRLFRHGAEVTWAPVDAVLAARDLSNLVVMAATLAVAVLCVCNGGLTSLIMNIPALAVVWGATYGLVRLGRWWRGVGPPNHEPPCRQR
jgi:hypothetical protein